MRKLIFITGFFAACSCSSLWASITVAPDVGVTVNGQTTNFLGTAVPCGASVVADVAGVASPCFSGSGTGTGYTFNFSGSEDPFLSWGFTSSLPGNYTVTFFTPIVGGASYNSLENAASLTITNLTNAATTITNIKVMAEVPAGTNIPGAELTDPSFSVPAHHINSTAIGDVTVNQAFTDPTSMEIVLSYTATGDGSAGFVGQAILSETPEPGYSVVGLGGTLAVLLIGRRKFRKA